MDAVSLPGGNTDLRDWLNVDYYQDNKGPICLAVVNRWFDQRIRPDERLALLCFDGLASVSRQALFAGRLPATFAETWHQTNKDADRWQAHWVNQNLAPWVAYAAVKVNGQGLDEVRAIADGKNKRLGVLTNLFSDNIRLPCAMSAKPARLAQQDGSARRRRR